MAEKRRDQIVGARYRVVRCIAAGGMSRVYEAVHVELGMRVAIKLLPTKAAADPELAARFRREGRAAAAIGSEYVVTVHDAGVDPVHGPYLVTELLAGEDLETRLVREERLAAEDAIAIGRQAALGLARAHAAGIVHRDVKPSNVFLTEHDDGALLVKILDFGVSKLLTGDDDEPLTAKGTALGTPQYMAPEQLEGALDIDGRVDVWSLAAVMYECLAGSAPFADRGGYLDILLSIARERVEPLRDRAPWVPAPLATVIDEALDRDREKRTQSAALFAEQLEQAAPKAWVRASMTMRRVSVPPAKKTSR